MNELKYAFVESYDTKIPLVIEEPYWTNIINYGERDFGYATEWNRFCNLIETKFNGDAIAYNKKRLKGIALLNNYERNKIEVLEKRLATESDKFLFFEGDGRLPIGGEFISVDCKDASFQKFNYFDLGEGKTFDQILKENNIEKEIFTFKGNKIRASHMFNGGDFEYEDKMLYKRLLYDVYYGRNKKMQKLTQGMRLCQIIGDEMIFVPKDGKVDMNVFSDVIGKDYTINGIVCHINAYRYDLATYSVNGTPYVMGIYRDLNGGPSKFRRNNNIHMLEMIKLYYGETVTEEDRMLRNGNFRQYPSKDKIELISINEIGDAK